MDGIEGSGLPRFNLSLVDATQTAINATSRLHELAESLQAARNYVEIVRQAQSRSGNASAADPDLLEKAAAQLERAKRAYCELYACLNPSLQAPRNEKGR